MTEKESMPAAFEVMKESLGSHFDPLLEQVFLLSREKLEIITEVHKGEREKLIFGEQVLEKHS